MSLKDRLISQLSGGAALRLDQFMAIALTDPEQGYYSQAPAIGSGGDFITAPEVSQIFGEMIGLWVLERWQALGSPENWRLIECGPGRGTLMSDAWRSLQLIPGAAAGCQITAVEINETLRAQQAVAWAGFPVTWTQNAETIPADLPTIIIGNEFLDALPVRQFRAASGLWQERFVTAAEGALSWVWQPVSPALQSLLPADQPDGFLFELSNPVMSVLDGITARLKTAPGAALLIDYGTEHQTGEGTFQALKDHRPVDPLEAPGKADLTAHVDFGACLQRGTAGGLAAFGPTAQGDFLEALGAHARAETLKNAATPAQRPGIDSALHRLTAPDQMGTLFKAICLQSPDLSPPPGFAS